MAEEESTSATSFILLVSPQKSLTVKGAFPFFPKATGKIKPGKNGSFRYFAHAEWYWNGTFHIQFFKQTFYVIFLPRNKQSAMAFSLV